MTKTSLHATLVAVMLVCALPFAVSGQKLKAREELQSPRSTNDTTELSARLEEIAQAALVARNQIRVNAQVDPETMESGSGKAARKVIESSIPETLAEHDAMSANYLSYTGAKTDLTVKSLRIKGAMAIMEATEHTVLNLSLAGVDPLAPEVTKYDQDHVFTFTLTKNRWTLASDRLINTFSLATPTPGEVLIPQGSPATDATWTNTPAPDIEEMQKSSRGGEVTTLATATLNRTAIVNYAYRYATNYNTTYRSYDGQGAGGDCTNFVSQAVYAGGWTYVSGFYTLNYVWWFNSKWVWPYQSNTWINAHLWFTFISSRPRATLARYVRDLVPGDILQADWNRDGRIDHSMVVTKKDSMGNIYLTYHSNNMVDKPFAALPTNATYYGWRLYTYPN